MNTRQEQAKNQREIAVATVSGKAYFMIVGELERRNVPFLSLVPIEPVPIGIKVVLTTETEKHLFRNEKTLIYEDAINPETLVSEALQIIQGKKRYEKMIIGVDPGETNGIAVLVDGNVTETANCFSIEETKQRIELILTNYINTSIGSVIVRVGDGVPAIEEKLLRLLDKALPKNVALESVKEAGTNRDLNGGKNRRGLRDIVSATIIARRNGQTFQRSNTNEPEN